MPTLETKNFQTFVSDQGNAMQAAVGSDLDFTVGSVLRALCESNATVALWLEALIVKVLQMSRASTSTGDDLDSWVGDYGLTRLPSVSATGEITLSRVDTSTDVVIPFESVVQTTDSLLQYSVVEDISNPYWDYSTELLQARYVLPSGTASGDFPIQCLVPGSVGNVLANTITRLNGSLGTINNVTNAVALINGQDEETDAALRARFLEFINTLARGTAASVKYAAESVQSGLRAHVVEKRNAQGQAQEGHFTIVLDNGSGTAPSSEILTSAGAKVNSYKPISVTFDLVGPSFVPIAVNISVNTNTDPVNTSAVVTEEVRTAIENFINGLALGEPLYVSEVAKVAFEASEQVVNVDVSTNGATTLTLNGSATDIMPAFTEVLRAGAITVNDLG